MRYGSVVNRGLITFPNSEPKTINIWQFPKKSLIMKLNHLLWLAFVATATAHEMEEMHDEHEMQDTHHQSIATASATPVPHLMHHQHGLPILQTDLQPLELEFWQNYNATNFLNVGGNKSALYTYFLLITLVFIFGYPLVMVLNNVRPGSPGVIIGSSIVAIGAIIAIINYFVFMSSVPDLYPGNVFDTFNGIYMILMPIWAALSIFKVVYIRSQNDTGYSNLDDDLLISLPTMTLYDLLRNASPSSFELEDQRDQDLEANDLKIHLQQLKLTKFTGIYNKLVHTPIISKFGKACNIAYSLINWFNFLFFCVYLPTGIAIFGCFGQGNTVFNLLAHFIKGGVFFMLGLLTLARYSGAYANKGWAWNYKMIHSTDHHNWWTKYQPLGLITMEWCESFLICFYGCTNIFMEHLANPGGEWSAKDLEHASIAFIFIGCGACGLIAEKKLNSWRYNYANSDDIKTVIKASPGFSPNPFPILCIFWTGILMSQHQQASQLSTKIHSQWGNLLAYGTFFRFATYVLQMLKPPVNKTRPGQPITELITSFALLAGGAIFMESCDPVILALEYRGFDAMFTLNVALGLVFLLMAWIMMVFQVKSWLKRYEV